MLAPGGIFSFSIKNVPPLRFLRVEISADKVDIIMLKKQPACAIIYVRGKNKRRHRPRDKSKRIDYGKVEKNNNTAIIKADNRVG